MADLFRFSQLQPYSLAGSGAVVGATSIILKSMLDIDGNPLTMSGTFGSIGYGTLQPGEGDQEEQISFTGLTNNSNGTVTLSGVKNVSFVYPYTETSGLSKTHPGSTTFIISNTSGFYDELTAKNNDETIEGKWTFNTVPASTELPVADDDLANKEYVLSVVNGGPVSTDSVIITGTAGETIAEGDLVYLLTADGLWYKTDADTSSTVLNVILGVAQGAGTVGVNISEGVLISGISPVNTGLTDGSTYYASNTAGGISTSAGTNSRAIGKANSDGLLVFDPYFNGTLSSGQVDALAGGGNLGTPGSGNKFITEDYAEQQPVVRVYRSLGSSSTQFDITNPAGTTFRYTYDTNGTDPAITSTSIPVGTTLYINAQNFDASNKGTFVVTGSGSNYFEVTNASGTAETNKTIGTGQIVVGGQTWTKPSGLKYITVESVGAGAGAGGAASGSIMGAGAGGSGGYAKKKIAVADLGSTETVTVGTAGAGGVAAGPTAGTNGGNTTFGSILTTNGGSGGDAGSGGVGQIASGGAGGTATGGDINIVGQRGGAGYSVDATTPADFSVSGTGGSNPIGFGGVGHVGTTSAIAGRDGTGYGAGGSGAVSASGGGQTGGAGSPGAVILTEFYI